MRIKTGYLVLIVTFFPFFSAKADVKKTVHHDISVTLKPAEHRLEVKDTITLPPTVSYRKEISFLLHGGLAVRSLSDNYVIVKAEPESPRTPFGAEGSQNAMDPDVPISKYLIRFKDGTSRAKKSVVILAYEGTIHHPIQSKGEEYARSFSQTPGIISEMGSVLSGSTHWVPWFGSDLVTFRLAVTLPSGRTAISQGKRVEHGETNGKNRAVWDSPHPVDEIYLIEGAFSEYADKAGKVNTYAFLRNPDPGLASRYLEATAQYLDMYSRLIGPYPYAKFALIENFWETGYGMPSFTLLGPTVIRFPFILRSSYPHEILHNWWGNSVFVAYEKGNWCEGLTAYMADHMLKEQQGKGAEYRRDTLQKYASYVRTGKDFPVREFRSRHDAATEAVGYGKALMLFHMLRMDLGDEKFIEGIKTFNREFQFKIASFEDIESVFSKTAEKDLKPFFTQWVDRTGAPDIKVDGYGYGFFEGEGAWLKLNLKQVQEEDTFKITVPVAVYSADGAPAKIYRVPLNSRSAEFELYDAKRIIKVEVDPAFDVFRRLHREEVPPTLGQLFGAEKVLILLPIEEKEGMLSAWEALAASWGGQRDGTIQVQKEDAIDTLPPDRSVWVIGRKNRWRPSPEQGLDDYGVKVGRNAIELGGESVAYPDHSFVIALRHPENPDQVICWLAADLPDSVPGLSRKLPHYGKYSYLAFKGSEPTNMLKGQWSLIKSPMVLLLEDEKKIGLAGPLPARHALAELPTPVKRDLLKAHAAFLTDDRLEGRGFGTKGLDTAAEYIAQCLLEYGLEPGGDSGSCYQIWEDRGGPKNQPARLKNVIAVLPGHDPALKDEPVVLGAHYDHLGRGWPDVHEGDEGKIHNGADDNASGIATLLELARLLGKSFRPARPIVFIAFTAEEAGLRGSRRYVEQLGSKKPFAMVNLDTVGRLGKNQPWVFGTDSAREWAFIAMGAGYTTGIGAKVVPNDPGSSDQVSFLNAGIPAIPIFSGINLDYHRPTDDLEKLDFEGMAAIVEFTKEFLVYLADRKEPLTVKIQASGTPMESKVQSKGRRASLGTVPDFAFQGEGSRVGAIVPGSPAESAGIETGDIITAIDDRPVKNLRGLSEALKAYNPGDTVIVHILRNEEKRSFTVKLGVR